MEVSWGDPPNHSFLCGIFHEIKPSSYWMLLGYPHDFGLPCFCPWKILNSWELRTGQEPHWTRSDPSSPSLEVPGSYHPTFPAPSESFEGRAPLKSSREDPQRRSGESQDPQLLQDPCIFPSFSHVVDDVSIFCKTMSAIDWMFSSSSMFSFLSWLFQTVFGWSTLWKWWSDALGCRKKHVVSRWVTFRIEEYQTNQNGTGVFLMFHTKSGCLAPVSTLQTVFPSIY